MTWGSLMKSTKLVIPMPCWQSFWYWKRLTGLHQIPFEQCWKQIHIFHGDWVKLYPWSLLSRLLLLIRLMWIWTLLIWLLLVWLLLELRLITRLLNGICSGCNSSNMLINWILLSRPPMGLHTNFLFLLSWKVVPELLCIAGWSTFSN